MASSEIDNQIWADLHSLGLNDIGAASVMGNMAQESSMNPNAPGGGLMQWIGSRWNLLVNYANSRGLSPNSEKAQVGYFGQELAAGNEGITLQGLNSESSPAAGALYISQNYERPDPAAANNANREQQANNFYSQYTGSSAPPAAASDLSSAGIYGNGLTLVSAGGSQAQNAAAFPKSNDIIDEVNQAMKIPEFNIFHPGQSLANEAGAIGLRVIMVIIGLIFIIFGLLAIVEKSGVTPPMPVPV